MFFLLLCAVLSEYFQPGVILQAHTSLVVRADRAYKDAPTNFLGQALITLFRIGTGAMALCLCLCTDEQFRFLSFIVVCGVIIGVVLVKMLCNQLLDYTFMLTRRFAPVYEHYGNIITIAAATLYPCLLVLLRLGNPIAARWVLGIIAVLFAGVWAYRTFRTYVVSLKAVLYIIVYLFTLEWLPLAALYIFSSQTILFL